jgi:hypothetical protein
LHEIAITADYGPEVEVNAGVKQGDQAVLSPPVDLEDGSKVQIRTTLDVQTVIEPRHAARCLVKR